MVVPGAQRQCVRWNARAVGQFWHKVELGPVDGFTPDGTQYERIAVFESNGNKSLAWCTYIVI